MEEQKISFEVAKLAKEKGFNEYCFNYYFEDGEFREHKYTGTNGYYGEEFSFDFDDLLEDWNSKFLTRKNGDRCFGCNKSEGYFETYSAPSQSLLQKWLREVHNINIGMVYFEYSGFGYWEYRLHYKNISGTETTYGLALEEGLKQALTLIKI